MPSSTANFVKISDGVTAKLNAAHLLDIPVHQALERWLNRVLEAASPKIPRDTSALADSMSVYVGSSKFPQAAGVRTNSRKFPFVHGAVTVPSGGRRRSEPHFPPPTQSLRSWSARHGIPLFLVQRAIARRGTPIIPFLSEAVDEMLPELDAELRIAAQAVGKEWAI